MDDKIIDRDLKRLREEFKHYHSSHLPDCPYCHKPFVNAVDGVTGLVSIHLWRPDCDCFSGHNFVLSLG